MIEMKPNQILIAFLLFQLSFVGLQARSSDTVRVALVIGAQNYTYVTSLKNPINDAQDMAKLLEAKKFKVHTLYDPKTKREVQDAVRKYLMELLSNRNSIGLVYYSGHGLQVDGSNYLVPVEADPQIKADLEDQCLNMDYVMRAIEQAGNQLNIFILDACRNNPFKGFERYADKGLNMVTAPRGSYIVYATKPGSVASDGSGRNGLFTSKLLKYIDEDGLNIEQVFKKVANDVAIESGDTQRPWIAMDYTGDFYFTMPVAPLEISTPVKPVVVETIEKPTVLPMNTRGEEQSKTDRAESLDYGYGIGDAPIVTIGKQTWTAKNLNVSTFANGDPIPEAKTAKEWRDAAKNGWPAWCYYNNDPGNRHTYGKLYNWYAVNDQRGLAPKGWHVPNDEEWNILLGQLGENASTNLKSIDNWQHGANGSNSSGFSAYPGGFRTHKGVFYILREENSSNSIEQKTFGLGVIGCWWSANDIRNKSEASFREISSAQIFRMLFQQATSIKDARVNSGILHGNTDKSWGFSVRCIKDVSEQ